MFFFQTQDNLLYLLLWEEDGKLKGCIEKRVSYHNFFFRRLFLAATKEGKSSPVVMENITLPCLKIVYDLVKPGLSTPQNQVGNCSLVLISTDLLR